MPAKLKPAKQQPANRPIHILEASNARIRSMLAACDDNAANHAWTIDRSGHIAIVPLQMGETLDDANLIASAVVASGLGEFGPEAAADPDFVDGVRCNLLDAWLQHCHDIAEANNDDDEEAES